MEMRMTTGFDIIGSNKALQDHWLRRIVALIIDGIILAVIAFLISIFFWILAPWGFIGWFFTGLLMFLYFIIFEMIMGGTPGKKMLSMEVVSTQQGDLDFVASLIRNVSKIFWVFLLIDWIIGMFTDGDPRQKFTDRYANTTVQRTDQQAYMEQQFRQMAYVPPHPTYQPPPGQPQQPSYQPPPQQQQQPQGQAGAWPHQEEKPKTDWPQHEPGQAPPQQQPPQQQPAQQPPPQQQSQPQPDAPRFCQNCGGTLAPGPDGRPTCGNCGRTY
jgi:uncharacterized RDD family membrane protein YckC